MTATPQTVISKAEPVPFRERTTPTLTAQQVVSYNEEAKRMRDTLNAPPHIRRQIQDAPTMMAQLRRLDKVLADHTPHAYQAHERDLAENRRVELEAQIVAGMPTQEEMRRNPSGAVEKHLEHERRNKNAILEWKNIKRRLQATECGNSPFEGSRDMSNVETLRPRGLGQSMDMHGAQIAGKDFHFPAEITPAVVFSEDELAALRTIRPDVADRLGLLNNDQRAAVKDILAGILAVRATNQAAPTKAAPKAAAKTKRKPMSPEAREAFKQRMAASRANRKAAE